MNGVPSCANSWLLNDVLRSSWQFDGYVTTDCDAASDVFNTHHYTPTPEEAVQVILRAGTDVDCGSFLSDNAASALAKGLITVEDIDAALRRLFRVRLRLGHFDAPSSSPVYGIGPQDVCNDYAQELMRDGARQSAVILKNDNRLLPLKLSSFATALAVGPNVDISDTWHYYAGSSCNGTYHKPAEALTQYIPGAVVLKGVPDVGSDNTTGVPAAAAAAAAADLVVLMIGSDLMLEQEGHDRTSIAFSDGQLALVAAVTAAAKGPVVALVMSGGAMDVSPLLANDKIGAVVHCGQMSSQIVGVGDVIFGKTPDGRAVAPAARMSQMTYPADIVNQVSMFDFGMRPGPSAWPPGTNPGRTYRFYTGVPVLPFGFGLSYTTWQYTPIPGPSPPSATSSASRFAAVDAAARAHRAAPNSFGTIPASLKEIAADFYVNVTNTGSVDSDDIVLGFLVPPGAGADGVPLQELFGFERVHVPAGQTVTVYLGAQGVRFCQADKAGVRHFAPGKYTVRIGVREAQAGGMGFAEFDLIV